MSGCYINLALINLGMLLFFSVVVVAVDAVDAVVTVAVIHNCQ